MFVTRWGDRRVTGKALLFSLMLHFGCLVGVVTVVPAPVLPPGDPDGGEQSHRVVIRSVTAQAERDFGADVGGPGQTPVWDRIANPGQMKPLGPLPTLPAPAAAPSVGRLAQAPKPAELPAPDLATLPDVQPPPTAPPLQESAATPKKSTQTPDIEVPKSAPLSKPAADTVPRPAARSTAADGGEPASSVTDNPRRPGCPRSPDESDPSRTVVAARFARSSPQSERWPAFRRPIGSAATRPPRSADAANGKRKQASPSRRPAPALRQPGRSRRNSPAGCQGWSSIGCRAAHSSGSTTPQPEPNCASRIISRPTTARRPPFKAPESGRNP